LGLRVLLVEQKLAFARKVGHQFCILDCGCAIAQGRIKDLDDSLIEQYLTV
jgi:urea transport system ATP-binding protein